VSVGCNPKAIHEALANQIRARISADVEVYAWPQRSPANKSVTVWPGSGGEWINYIETFGANGTAIMMVELVIDFDSIDDESEFALLSDLASCGTSGGTGAPSSLFDAVHSDRSLGGAVQDAIVLTASWSADPSVPLQARLPVQIILSKVQAEV
jgi:hypothetical protein